MSVPSRPQREGWLLGSLLDDSDGDSDLLPQEDEDEDHHQHKHCPYDTCSEIHTITKMTLSKHLLQTLWKRRTSGKCGKTIPPNQASAYGLNITLVPLSHWKSAKGGREKFIPT